MTKKKLTVRKRRPRKPHPDCTWDAKNGIWLWPDDRTPQQREGDDLAEKAALSGEWEKHGFKLVRSVTFGRRVRSSKAGALAKRRTAPRPRKPHPDCTWNEKHQVWIWPDDRSPERQKADEEIARMCEERDIRNTGRSSPAS